KVIFPTAAKQWIQNNVKYHLQISELYKHLQLHKLIDTKIHTKEQEYLESKQNFKITYYLENDFIRALEFTTPLLNHIGITNLKEIIVDSTFKTNQKWVKLFIVNANCGEYGIPVAYFYLLTCDGTSEVYNNLKNQVNTRIQALREFFTSLRNEKLLPIFVLIDKDAGEISAIEEKSKSSGYSKNKAMEAHQQFNFIDPLWIPSSGARSLCPDDKIKKFIDIIKRHTTMHPLIPVAKNTFWNSAQIYQYCIQEIYQFCYNHNFSKLWNYLWINWYNKKDWKLFARSAYSSAMPLARTTMITESH
ncbi:hypothetical protein C1646_757270, partial [Rhizophagus diaphanus]